MISLGNLTVALKFYPASDFVDEHGARGRLNMSRKFNAKVPVACLAKSDELLQKIPPTHGLWTNAINATKLRKFTQSNEVTKMARTPPHSYISQDTI
jgi:hypothetical protein